MTDAISYDRPNTVSGLVAKHKELSDLREKYRAEIKKLTIDIDHLDAAIPSAASAYLESYEYLQQKGVCDSHGRWIGRATQSNLDNNVEESELPETPQKSHAGRNEQPALQAPKPTVTPVGADVLILADGGTATLTLPESLTQNEYDDLVDWMEMMAKRAKRRIVSDPTEH